MSSSVSVIACLVNFRVFDMTRQLPSFGYDSRATQLALRMHHVNDSTAQRPLTLYLGERDQSLSIEVRRRPCQLIRSVTITKLTPLPKLLTIRTPTYHKIRYNTHYLAHKHN